MEIEAQARGETSMKAIEREMKETRLEDAKLVLCQRHVPQGPLRSEDSHKAEGLNWAKAAMKEDSATCNLCIAKAAALLRIEQAGGDRIKAAEDSKSRIRGEIRIIRSAAAKEEEGESSKTAAKEGESAKTAAKEKEGGAKPVFMKKMMKVRPAYIKSLLMTGRPRVPLRPLPDDFFRKNPQLRETMLASGLAALSSIETDENILWQFFDKGYAMTEVQVNYN